MARVLSSRFWTTLSFISLTIYLLFFLYTDAEVCGWVGERMCILYLKIYLGKLKKYILMILTSPIYPEISVKIL